MRRTHRNLVIRERANGAGEVVEVSEDNVAAPQPENLLQTLQDLECERAEAIAKIEQDHLNKMVELGFSVDV